MEFKIDLAQNSASLKISEEIYRRILGTAVAQTEKDLLELQNALPVSDFPKIQLISHRLKGDFANMRIMELSSIAKQMNDITKTTQDKEQLSALLHQFKIYFQQLQNCIQKAS